MLVRFTFLAFVAAVLLASGRESYAVSDLLPNLIPLKASELRTEVEPATGHLLLRFTTTSWNSGNGPLEIVAKEVIGNETQKVDQRIYRSDGTYYDEPAGDMAYHPSHAHFHFDDYAIYTLQPLNAPGESARTGVKTTFCIIDTNRIDGRLPGAPKRAAYTTCSNTIQGMSVGWGDQYRYYLEGQSIDITDLLDGDYRLTIEVDPRNLLFETNEADNVSTVDLRLTEGVVQVIGSKGRPNR